jgi:exodeoxyribonuclease VIII
MTTATQTIERIECDICTYHAHPALSHSQTGDYVVEFRDGKLVSSPENFYELHVAKTRTKPITRAMEDGTIAHTCLETHQYVDQVVSLIPDEFLTPSGARSTSKAAKAWYAEHDDECLRTAAEIVELDAMVRSPYQHKAARQLLDADGEVEIAYVWEDHATGLQQRCRPDKVAAFGLGRALVDWKTTRHQFSPHAFGRDAFERGYHRQLAWYEDGLRAAGQAVDAYVLVAVGNAPPYRTEVYEVPADAVELGRRQNRQILSELAERFADDNWHPETHGTVQQLTLPAYAFE